MSKEVISFIRECIEKDIIDSQAANNMVDYLELKERSLNIWKWAKYYFPHKFTEDFCQELHGYLYSIKEQEITSTLAPRSHGKTIISCFLIPMYLSLHSKVYRHFLNVQNTTQKAIGVNLSIRHEFEFNELLIRDYGDQVEHKKWTEKVFVLKNGTIFSAVGAGESIRGINYNNIRPDYIICDDLYTEEDIGQPQRVKKVNDWFWSTLYPARANNKKTSIHVQGTAISSVDLMHKLKDAGKIHKCFKAIKNDEKEETLWFSYNQLIKDKESMGTLIFSREYQNELRDDDTSIIKESWIKYYDGHVPSNEEVKYFICGIDPAIGEKKTNDCTGKVACYITKNSNFYICDALNSRLSFNANLEDIKSFHKKHKFKQVRIECISAFKAFAQELRRTTRIPVKEIKSVKDKITRLENVSHLFENGKVFISNQISHKVKDELIYQLINNKPNHDDLRDALILCLEKPRSTNIYI